jgi:hypothetical protein
MNLNRPLCALLLTIGVAASVQAEEPAIAAPPIAVGFPSASSSEIRPADSTGAVSETYVLAGSSAGIRVHTRDGSIVSEQTLHQFWHSAAGTGMELRDPRIAYDIAARRWIAVSMRGFETLMLGVSASDDPTGAWFRHEIPFHDSAADRTRLALTRDTIMVSLQSDGGQSILSFSKAEVYAGAANPAIRQAVVEIDSVPVNAPESAVEYFVTVGQSQLKVRRLDRLNGPARLFDGGFWWKLPTANSARMAGTRNELLLGRGDVQSAVFRDGWLYAVHRIGTSMRTEDDNALLWWKVDPEGIQPSETGIIDSPGDTAYAYPSLAVNRLGGMLISFCTLSKTTYPSASFVYRDPEGHVSNPAILRTGDTPVTGHSDWGEYTTVVEDPNGRDFWAGQIYATGQSWGTWWANVTIPAPPRARAVRH